MAAAPKEFARHSINLKSLFGALWALGRHKPQEDVLLYLQTMSGLNEAETPSRPGIIR